MAFWQKVFRTWTRHVLQGNPRAVSDAPRSRPRHIRRPPKRSSIGIFVIFSSPSVRRPPFSGNMGMIPHEAGMHPHPFEFSNTSCLSGGRRSPDRRPVFPRRTGVRRRLCAAPPRHHVPLRRERGAAGAFALLPKARPAGKQHFPLAIRARMKYDARCRARKAARQSASGTSIDFDLDKQLSRRETAKLRPQDGRVPIQFNNSNKKD